MMTDRHLDLIDQVCAAARDTRDDAHGSVHAPVTVGLGANIAATVYLVEHGRHELAAALFSGLGAHLEEDQLSTVAHDRLANGIPFGYAWRLAFGQNPQSIRRNQA